MSETTLMPGTVIETLNGSRIIGKISVKSGRIVLDTLPVHDRVNVIKRSIAICWNTEKEIIFPSSQAPEVGDIIENGNDHYLVTDQRFEGELAFAQVVNTSAPIQERKRYIHRH